MINKIVKQLKENEKVSDYRIIENNEKSHQAFFVLGKLETTRLQETTEYEVTVYVRHDEKIGSSTFTISHSMSKKEINELIDGSVKAASFVFNKDFNLVEGEKKKSFKDKPFPDEFDVMVKKISEIFDSVATDSVKSNATEVFYNEKTKKIINSKGVNLSSTTYNLEIESIPSFDGKEKVEVYNFNTYSKLDYDQIRKDCIQSVKDVTAREDAVKIEKSENIDVLLKGHDVAEFFNNMIGDYSYASVLSGQQEKKIGDDVQEKDSKTLINLSIGPSTKAHAFDNDGVIISKTEIIKNGQLSSYFGSNQYASYLGVKPTGMADEVEVEKGALPIFKITGKRYLEIIKLSGIQIDVYGDYIGGEIRLAVLHDGRKKTPVSGLSFSGSFKEAMKSFEISKETSKIRGYSGPSFMIIRDMKIM